MADKPQVTEWPVQDVSGGKRANLEQSLYMGDWFCGYGKDENCQFEGTWWDMICFARNVLASENTRMAAPEFYKPEWKNNNDVGEQRPYDCPPVVEGG